MLIRNVRVWPVADAESCRELGPRIGGASGRELADVPVTDVRITGDRVAERAPGLRAARGEDEIDAAGGTLLPGLHDHHVHLRALAAARASVEAGPPHVRTADGLASRLRAADAAAPPGAWLRCVGYHESVAGPLDRWALDQMLAGRPVRVQHRTGVQWVVNSAAVALLGLDACDQPGVERDAAGRPTGRLWRMDGWLAGRVPGVPPDLAAVSLQAASFGVTGFTDATPGAADDDLAALAAAVADGTIAQRVHHMAPAHLSAAPRGRLTVGPVKVLLDDDTLPRLDEFGGQISRAHAAGRPVAVHCVTRVQFVLTLAALEAAGRLAGDRIEHGAVIPAECVRDLRGLTVVTQPHFVAERGEQYATDVAPGDLPDLWRLRTLLEAGVAVAAGTDAPFGGADPWHVMRAATRRPANIGPGEAVTGAQAIGLFLGEPTAPATPRLVAPGQPADLVLLRCPPLAAARALDSDLVAATLVGGEVVFARDV